MKHALRILVPMVVVVALLAGAAWYFLSFRPDLACQFYVSRAESAAAAGRYGRAVDYYARAWDLNPEDPQLAIELARAYVQDNNYTKAEYTLVSAITQLPDCLDLYLELSRTYVAQNKLLDADQMLSRTNNDAIKAQLDELRPAAPVLQPESGSYTEYISVSLAYTGGEAYLAVDGDYPSMETDAYTGPVALEAGETTVVAIVVSEDGLVSPAVTAGYTIGGIVEEAAFSDAAVEAAVRTVLSKADGEAVMTDELWSLTTLELDGTVTTLDDLAVCSGMTSLTVTGAYGADLSALGSMTSLESLTLRNCTVTSGALEAIASLPNLKELTISGCALTDITPLGGCTGLTNLDLSDNVISDISALSSLTELVRVDLGGNAVSAISALAAASGLEWLDLSGNQVSSLTPLRGKTALQELRASGNLIADLSPLAECPALTVVDVSDNAVTDLTPLAGLTELVELSADNNAITAIPDFSAAQSLSRFSASTNAITDVTGLGGLPVLNYVNLDYNQVSDLSPLLTCQTLVQLDVFGCPVTDVSELQSHGVIVNYDPTYTGTES